MQQKKSRFKRVENHRFSKSKFTSGPVSAPCLSLTTGTRASSWKIFPADMRPLEKFGAKAMAWATDIVLMMMA
jgi:hypothetical protein